jgi:hypothetical protein
MKTLSAIALFFWSATYMVAQDAATCERIVAEIYEAVNQQNAEPIMQYLADDFTIAGQQGEIARLVVPQLFAQLGVKVTAIEKVSEQWQNGLTLKYEGNFGDNGKRTSSFVFNESNQLREMNILEMEVMVKGSEASINKSSDDYFTVPFQRLGNLIAVEAELNGVKRLFIVDNGAPTLVLNSAHFQKDTTVQRKTISSTKGAGGVITGMGIERINSFALPGISMDAQEVIAMDLSHLEAALETEFYGLIGYEIYRDYDLLFDYPKNELTFIKPEATPNYLRANFPAKKVSEVPLALNGHIASVQTKIKGRFYNLGIDCGAESNLLDLSYQEALMRELTEVTTDTLKGADTNAIAIQSGKLKKMRIGNRQFKDTQTSFSDISHLNEGYDIKLDGLIGYEILSRQLTLLSYANKRMIFLE